MNQYNYLLAIYKIITYTLYNKFINFANICNFDIWTHAILFNTLLNGVKKL